MLNILVITFLKNSYCTQGVKVPFESSKGKQPFKLYAADLHYRFLTRKY